MSPRCLLKKRSGTKASLAFFCFALTSIAVIGCKQEVTSQPEKARSDIGQYLPVQRTNVPETKPPSDTPTGPRVVVKEPTLKSLEILAPNIPMTVGTSQDLKALAIFGDDPRKFVAADVTWSTDLPDIAEFSSDAKTPNRLMAKKIGIVKIQGSYKGTTVATNVQIVEPQIERIELPPNLRNFLVGIPQRFSATAVYTNGLTMSLDTGLTWRSTEPEILVEQSGQPSGTFKALVAKSYGLVVESASISASFSVTARIPDFSSIRLQSGPLQMPMGLSNQWRVFGVLTDKTEIEITQAVTWSSSKTSAVTVSAELGRSGVVKAVGSGSATIRASIVSKGKTLTASKDVGVVTANYREIKITGAQKIPLHYKKNLKAVGVLNDFREVDITNEVEWSSAAPAVASVSNISPGQVTAVAKGTTKITVNHGEKQQSVDVVITDVALVELEIVQPSDPIQCGDPAKKIYFSVNGVLSDGSASPDLNEDSKLSWVSGDTDLVEISSALDTKGLLTSKKPGQVMVKAKYYVQATDETIEASVLVDIGPPVASGYFIKPEALFVIMGQSIGISAFRKYSCPLGGDPNPIPSSEITWSMTGGQLGSTSFVKLEPQGAAAMSLLTTPLVDGNRVLLPSNQTVLVKMVTKSDKVTADCSDGTLGGCPIQVRPREILKANLNYPPDQYEPKVDVGATVSPSVDVQYSDGAWAPYGAEAQLRHGLVFELTTESPTGAVDFDVATGEMQGQEVGTATVRVVISRPSSTVPITTTKTVQVSVPCESLDNTFVSGKRFSGHCYYRGERGQNCVQVCADNRRTYDARGTELAIGVEAQCAAVIKDIFNIPDRWYDPTRESIPSTSNVGCRVDETDSATGAVRRKPYLDLSTAITSSGSALFATRICGCK